MYITVYMYTYIQCALIDREKIGRWIMIICDPVFDIYMSGSNILKNAKNS